MTDDRCFELLFRCSAGPEILRNMNERLVCVVFPCSLELPLSKDRSSGGGPEHSTLQGSCLSYCNGSPWIVTESQSHDECLLVDPMCSCDFIYFILHSISRCHLPNIPKKLFLFPILGTFSTLLSTGLCSLGNAGNTGPPFIVTVGLGILLPGVLLLLGSKLSGVGV